MARVWLVGRPLNAGQNGCYVICWAPSILQNIQAEFASTVDVWVKHLADEFDAGRLVGILFFEVHNKTECTILKGGICWADDDSVPTSPYQCKLRAI